MFDFCNQFLQSELELREATLDLLRGGIWTGSLKLINILFLYGRFRPLEIYFISKCLASSRLADDGVVYAEIRFCPELHTKADLSLYLLQFCLRRKC